MQHKQLVLPANVTEPLGLSSDGDELVLLYRSRRRGTSKLAIATSNDGHTFYEADDEAPMILNEHGVVQELEHADNIKIVRLLREHVLTYQDTTNRIKRVRFAVNDLTGWDLANFEKISSNINVPGPAQLFPSIINDHYYLASTHRDGIILGRSDDLSHWERTTIPIVQKRPNQFDSDKIELISIELTPEGFLVFYSSTKKTHRAIGAVLLAKENPEIIIWRSDAPLAEWDESRVSMLPKLLGTYIDGDQTYLYAYKKSVGLVRMAIGSALHPSAQESAEPAWEPVWYDETPEVNLPTKQHPKVLMFGWELPPHNKGGLGVACLGLCRGLLKEDVDVTFVLPKHNHFDQPAFNLKFAGVKDNRVHHIDSILSPCLTAHEYDSILKGKNPHYGTDLYAEVLRYAELAAHVVEDSDFDIIHAHDWLSILAGVKAKEISGKPLVLHIHTTSTDMAGGGDVDPRIFEIENVGFAAADRIICVSHYTKSILVQKHDVDPDKITVVHNGIDDHTFDGVNRSSLPPLHLKQQGWKLVLFVGRLTLHKGPDWFLKTAKRVLDERPETMFVVSGSGDMERRMIEQAAQLGIANKVHFAGFTRGDELTQLYRAADLYILPSVSEPFGITPLESIVSGTPVLVSRQSGVSEVLTHALKADFWDTEDMANKVISVLDHPHLHRQLRESGLSEVRKLTWHRSAKHTLSIYHDTLSKVGSN